MLLSGLGSMSRAARSSCSLATDRCRLLVHADDGTAVLADGVRYSLRLTDADDVSTY
ncbi:hypothetical protein [Streptomyces venezuelae]|uniref:hypothetical protein n=1 Tax=Streptomyces venezuelae TaxID=54571 RepID=UPI00278C475D|nr:hypothetical protein [Streptomyces venezuelae]